MIYTYTFDVYNLYTLKMKTFKELYHELPQRNSITTPKKRWVKEIAGITCKTEKTVRTWLSKTEPDELTKKTLAENFNCKPEDLFPPKN